MLKCFVSNEMNQCCIYLLLFVISGFYKIRLLKNYDRIVEEIVPMEILSKIPYFMISEGDRCDVMDIESQHKKTRALLNILLNSDKSIYNAFLAALRQDAVYEELARDIEMTPGMLKYITLFIFSQFLISILNVWYEIITTIFFLSSFMNDANFHSSLVKLIRNQLGKFF